MDMIKFFANEYEEDDWNTYVNCFDKLNISIEGIPQDIVNVVLTILGDDAGYRWIHTPLNKFNGKNALDLLKTSEGEKALKAFIMRLPN